jgi:hypothetical protein
MLFAIPVFVPHPIPGGAGCDSQPTTGPARFDDRQTELKRRASDDLDCAAWAIHVAEPLDGTAHVIASGCGHGALYSARGGALKLQQRW